MHRFGKRKEIEINRYKKVTAKLPSSLTDRKVNTSLPVGKEELSCFYILKL